MTSCVFETWSESAVATSHASFSPIRRDARPGPQAGGDLRVVTTRLRPGYLRKNGVPYSANAVLTEYWDVVKERNGDSLIVITSTVDDPMYLRETWITALHFKKEPTAAKWAPTPCSATW